MLCVKSNRCFRRPISQEKKEKCLARPLFCRTYPPQNCHNRTITGSMTSAHNSQLLLLVLCACDGTPKEAKEQVY